MTVPGRQLIFVALVMAPVLLGALVEPVLWVVVLIADALLVAWCLVQGRMLARTRVTVEREGWTRVEIERSAELVYRVENISQHPVIVSIRQPWPQSFEAESQWLEVRVEPGEIVRAALAVTPRRRGRIAVPAAQVDVRYPADLTRRRWALDDGAVLTVYPNLQTVAEYDVLRRHHALGQLGIHRMRMIGAGLEFDQLRAYIPDDDYRDINWKATARRRSPITNVYQAERTQDVLLCLDCGRMMGNPVGAGTALDRAIDTSIVLAHVCRRSSDRVGLVLFRDVVNRFIKPVSGTASINRIVEELVDAASENVFPSYSALVSSLRVNQKRRGMVFLFTDLNDPQLATNLTEVLPLVSRRHVFVVVSLRDPLLDLVAAGAASNPRGVCQVFAARELADERATRVRELAQAGVQVLEADADSITLDVINCYLTIKMRQLV